MTFSKRAVMKVLGVMVVSAAAFVPQPARAETCVSIPGSFPGMTIEAADVAVRVTRLSDMSVCAQVPGLVGTPAVVTEPDGGVSVVITEPSGEDGWFLVKFEADGGPQEIGLWQPGGDGDELCILGIGFPARADCEVKVSFDEPPAIPPLP